MNFNFKGQTVVVTGASRGIGRGIAFGFAQAGARVAFTYQSNTEAAQKTLSELPGRGHQMYQFDVSQADAVEETLTRINNEMGGIQTLVNNAGITRDQLLLRLKPEDWDAVLTTNLKSVFLCTKIAVKLMMKSRKKDGSGASHATTPGATGPVSRPDSLASTLSSTPQPSGLGTAVHAGGTASSSDLELASSINPSATAPNGHSIINITSVIGQTGNAGQTSYAASKAGIIAFTKSAALEVASRQIRLNCIAPGFIRSDMTDSLSEEQRRGILEKVPLGAMGESSDVAHGCLFLASSFARYITGHTLDVNGGLYMN